MRQRRPHDGPAGQIAPPNPAHAAATAQGDVVLEGEAGYDEARKVWNGAIDKRLAMIAYCVDAEDVARAIAFAGSHRIRIGSAATATTSPACRPATAA